MSKSRPCCTSKLILSWSGLGAMATSLLAGGWILRLMSISAGAPKLGPDDEGKRFLTHLEDRLDDRGNRPHS